jgi:hypothetical protein
MRSVLRTDKSVTVTERAIRDDIYFLRQSLNAGFTGIAVDVLQFFSANCFERSRNRLHIAV